MRFEPDTVYHIYNRGNNKQRIFFSERNYAFFFQKLEKHIRPHCEILSWCLMPNHFHLMICATQNSCIESYGTRVLKVQALTYWIGIVQSSYAQAVNKQNGTSGSLFQSKTKAKPLYEKEYIINCLNYIHQNPYKAGLERMTGSWQYSSFTEYARMDFGGLCNKELLYQLSGYNRESILDDCFSDVDEGSLFY